MLKLATLSLAVLLALASPAITAKKECLAPAKFPDAVEKATKIRPNLPQRLSYLMNAKETFKVLPNSEAAVKAFILSQV